MWKEEIWGEEGCLYIPSIVPCPLCLARKATMMRITNTKVSCKLLRLTLRQSNYSAKHGWQSIEILDPREPQHVHGEIDFLVD